MVAVHFEVDRRGRGVASNRVVVEAEPKIGFNCGMTFGVGERYIVYANRAPGGELTTTGSSSGTRLASTADADLAFLKEVTGPARGVRIFGRVHRWESNLVTTRPQDYGAVSGARVQLSGPTSREVTTGRDGSYDVRNLPAGTYTVTITPPKGLALYHPYYPRDQQPPPPTMTLTHPFECAEASAWPRTDSQITGVLLDSAGRPAAGEPVELIAAANATSRDKQIPHLSARTDPEGRFAFAFMPPGNYLVGVNLKNPPPASQVDLRSYHPGVSEPPRATVVAVEAGSRIQLAPFQLAEPPLERRFTGAVVWSDGTPALEARVTLTGARSEPVAVDATGRFTLTLPLGAQFILSASAPGQVNGRRVIATSLNQQVGRYDRDGGITLVLRLAQ